MRTLKTLALCLVVAGLAACAGKTDTPDGGTGPKNMIFRSYEAADQLLALVGDGLEPTQPLLVASLADEENLDQSSPFGRLMSEQIASRLVNAGYTVNEVLFGDILSVRQGTGQLILSRNMDRIGTNSAAQAVVAGTYTTARDQIFVNLRMIRASDGRVMASHDFLVPMDDNVRYLARPKRVLVY